MSPRSSPAAIAGCSVAVDGVESEMGSAPLGDPGESIEEPLLQAGLIVAEAMIAGGHNPELLRLAGGGV